MAEEQQDYELSFWTLEPRWGDLPKEHELPHVGFWSHEMDGKSTTKGGLGRVWMNAHADHSTKLWEGRVPPNVMARLSHEIPRHIYKIHISPWFKKFQKKSEDENETPPPENESEGETDD